MSSEEENQSKKTLKRIPRDSIALQFAGDLILAKKPGPEYIGFFRRYESLFEALANADRTERLLRYKILAALMLTSYAKKENDRPKRRALFEMKNKLYFDIAGNRQYRSMVGFKYLVSKNFRVVEFCPKCQAENATSDLPRHKWKFCKDCNVDHNFYNVLSMFHRFDNGSLCIYLSHELIDDLPIKNLTKKKGKIEDFKEEGRYENFTYNVKNLDSFKLDSVTKLYDKVLGK